MSGALCYTVANDLSADEFIDALKRSGLAERRPVKDRARIETMLRNADLIVTARNEDGLLVGVSRCVTDFAFACYCSELAVDRAFQRRGIGTQLIETCAADAGEGARFFLFSAPAAVGFYEKIGMARHPDAFERPGWKRFLGTDARS
jgi:ribosomal protein S18 acetylase RimI-like enzyme